MKAQANFIITLTELKPRKPTRKNNLKLSSFHPSFFWCHYQKSGLIVSYRNTQRSKQLS